MRQQVLFQRRFYQHELQRLKQMKHEVATQGIIDHLHLAKHEHVVLATFKRLLFSWISTQKRCDW